MTEFTMTDGVALGVVLLSALLSYSRGFTREMMSIVGWVLAGVLGFAFAASVQPLMKEVPVIGGFLESSCELSVLAAFIVVFAFSLLASSLFTPLVGLMVQRSFLNAPDQMLGLLFGVARGSLLVVVALIVYDRAFTSQNIAMVANSHTASLFTGLKERIDKTIPSDAPGWVTDQYTQLMGACSTPTPRE